MKRWRWHALAVALAVAPAACADRTLPPRGQVLLYVDTDAPLGDPPDAPVDPSAPAPLFDRLRVDVTTEDGTLACTACSRDFVVDRRQLDAEALSMGILPNDARRLFVRARFFRASVTRGGEPVARSTIDRRFVLPGVSDEGITELTAFLSLADLGKTADEDEPAELARGRIYQHRLYDGVAPRDCADTQPPGQVCIPGGAFWMNSAEASSETTGLPAPERVVVLSPFWLDAREVTVRDLRASGLATATDPVRASQDHPECVYTDAPGAAEDLPVTCIGYALAAKLCATRGAEIPTEAQIEFVGSGRRSDPYVWGHDPPECGDAVFARGKVTSSDGLGSACTALGRGSAPAGTGKRDVLHLPTGDVFDIAGNVGELASDFYQLPGEPCLAPGLYRDPFCEKPSKRLEPGTSGRTVRGGNWTNSAQFMKAAFSRDPDIDHQIATDSVPVGFRCARKATPR